MLRFPTVMGRAKTRAAILSLSLFLLAAHCASGQEGSIRLPKDVKAVLDRRFPGWIFPEVSADVRGFLRTNFAGARPDLIQGDFDGNGQLDYALLILHGKVYNGDGVAFDDRELLVVLLRRGRGFKSYILDWLPHSSEFYLALVRKGERGYDYRTDKDFRYANDTVEACWAEKASQAYVYRRGRFKPIITGD